jgi:hypothetical protein
MARRRKLAGLTVRKEAEIERHDGHKAEAAPHGSGDPRMARGDQRAAGEIHQSADQQPEVMITDGNRMAGEKEGAGGRNPGDTNGMDELRADGIVEGG